MQCTDFLTAFISYIGDHVVAGGTLYLPLYTHTTQSQEHS